MVVVVGIVVVGHVPKANRHLQYVCHESNVSLFVNRDCNFTSSRNLLRVHSCMHAACGNAESQLLQSSMHAATLTFCHSFLMQKHVKLYLGKVGLYL